MWNSAVSESYCRLVCECWVWLVMFFFFLFDLPRNAEQQRILWKIPDISQKSENGGKKTNKKPNFIWFDFIASYVIWCMFLVSAPGVGSLLARFQITNGPSKPAPLAVQFTSEGSTLSGCDIELLGSGYRFSLIKKRFAAGENETSSIREHYSKLSITKWLITTAARENILNIVTFIKCFLWLS